MWGQIARSLRFDYSNSAARCAERWGGGKHIPLSTVGDDMAPPLPPVRTSLNGILFLRGLVINLNRVAMFVCGP